jgi:aldehyde:ferredoxin oxidoreductase
VVKAVDFLMADEASRAFLTSMVACLFARGVYTEELLADCLKAVGYGALADSIDMVSRNIQKLRWQTRLATGFDPASVSIPKRFTEVTTWKGKVDGDFLAGLKNAYSKAILTLARQEDQQG